MFMLNTKMFSRIWSSVAVLGLLFATPGEINAAPMPNHSSSTTQFRRIEQPILLKVAVTISGLGLIGLELWWFLLSKTKAQQTMSARGIQEATITVDGGYQPDRLVVQVGQPVKLNFLRKDPSSCLEKVLFPDFHIATDLKLNQITSVEFTPQQPGEYQFTCGMNMYRGVVEAHFNN